LMKSNLLFSKKICLIIVLLSFFTTAPFAQIIRGCVKDAKNGETLNNH
jgi:ABC-type dipeptide/oligopeptide/nickel transport system permease subunit